MDRHFYYRFVKGENDIVGKLAFTFYKEEEFEFASKCKNSNPTKKEKEDFQKDWSDARIKDLRNRAEDFFDSYSESIKKTNKHSTKHYIVLAVSSLFTLGWIVLAFFILYKDCSTQNIAAVSTATAAILSTYFSGKVLN